MRKVTAELMGPTQNTEGVLPREAEGRQCS